LQQDVLPVINQQESLAGTNTIPNLNPNFIPLCYATFTCITIPLANMSLGTRKLYPANCCNSVSGIVLKLE